MNKYSRQFIVSISLVWAFVLLLCIPSLSQSYRRIIPKKIKASNYQKKEADDGSTTYNFNPENIFDGDPFTAWSSGDTDGKEWLKFSFKDIQEITKITIQNGWCAAINEYDDDFIPDNWKLNSRVKQINVSTSAGDTYQIKLADTPYPQDFNVNITATWVLFELVDVYKVDGHEEMILSEVIFHYYSPNQDTNDSKWNPVVNEDAFNGIFEGVRKEQGRKKFERLSFVRFPKSDQVFFKIEQYDNETGDGSPQIELNYSGKISANRPSQYGYAIRGVKDGRIFQTIFEISTDRSITINFPRIRGRGLVTLNRVGGAESVSPLILEKYKLQWRAKVKDGEFLLVNLTSNNKQKSSLKVVSKTSEFDELTFSDTLLTYYHYSDQYIRSPKQTDYYFSILNEAESSIMWNVGDFYRKSFLKDIPNIRYISFLHPIDNKPHFLGTINRDNKRLLTIDVERTKDGIIYDKMIEESFYRQRKTIDSLKRIEAEKERIRLEKLISDALSSLTSEERIPGGIDGLGIKNNKLREIIYNIYIGAFEVARRKSNYQMDAIIAASFYKNSNKEHMDYYISRNMKRLSISLGSDNVSILVDPGYDGRIYSVLRNIKINMFDQIRLNNSYGTYGEDLQRFAKRFPPNTEICKRFKYQLDQYLR